MRRYLALSLLLSLLVLPAKATEPQPYAAFVIDSGPNGKYTRQLLEGLYDRGIRATFLLRGYRMAEYPDILADILEDGHEAACRGFTGENMTVMSRRAIAGELMEFQALLPPGYPLTLFCPPGGSSDGVRQVAEARKLVILSWSVEGNSQIRDGDLITDDYFGRKVIRTALREKMPSYMAPKRVIFLDELPVTNNGKLDRKRLREMA